MRKVLLCLILTASLLTPATAAWLETSDFDDVNVVVAPDNEVDAKAAAVFIETWSRCTGSTPTQSIEPRSSAVNVWIGSQSTPEEWLEQYGADSLGYDGILVQTRTGDERTDLILTGAPARGTLFAVYEFFEKAFGIRWLAPGVIRVPEAPVSIEHLSIHYTPPLGYRWTALAPGADPDAYRMSQRYRYGLGGHSYYFLLPPDKYFEQHPEFYSEINGKRIAPVGYNWEEMFFAANHPEISGQLCMSNPATAEAIARELIPRIQENPDANLWSVAQMDWGNNCQCEACRKIDEAEGSPAASMLVGVNRVAEIIERHFPDVYIHTYAYTWTRKPPRTIRPRHNVMIQLCTFECDFSRPLNDPASAVNVQFMEDFEGWKQLGANLLIYDYPINCRYMTRPFPNFHVLGPNIDLFADYGSIGVFEQGLGGITTAFGFLRPYLISKLLWNPSADPDVIIDEFLDGYYGPAGQSMKEYIELCRQTLLDSSLPLYIFDECRWMDTEFVTKAEAIFDEAFKAVDSDLFRSRLEVAHFQVLYASLLCQPTVEAEDQALLLHFPINLSRTQLRQAANELGIEAGWPGWWPSIDGMFAPLPEQRRREERLPFYRIENDRYLVWVAPDQSGSVLRFLDKVLNKELLRGYTHAGYGRGTWQDWLDRNTNDEGPVADHYAVIEHSDRRLVISATTSDNLRVTRTMELGDGQAPLDVTLSIQNSGEDSTEARVKSHPEFDCQRPGVIPEIWIERRNHWECVNQDKRGVVAADFFKIDGAVNWAFYLPDEQFGLLCSVAPGDVDQLLYFYDTNPGIEHINLELIPMRSRLQPDQSRTIRARYETIHNRPDHD